MQDIILDEFATVTPHVGVWIETPSGHAPRSRAMVTPHVGVWIETSLLYAIGIDTGSHPSRRGVD